MAQMLAFNLVDIITGYGIFSISNRDDFTLILPDELQGNYTVVV